MNAGLNECWCAAFPPLLAVPEGEAAGSCYCPACLRRDGEAQGRASKACGDGDGWMASRLVQEKNHFGGVAQGSQGGGVFVRRQAHGRDGRHAQAEDVFGVVGDAGRVTATPALHDGEAVAEAPVVDASAGTWMPVSSATSRQAVIRQGFRRLPGCR